MPGRTVYVVHGEGEEALAQELVRPLSQAGYHVTHHGTVLVGESLVGEAASALASDAPIVLCATRTAVGSAWAHQISRAAQVGGRVRVFVVQMEQQAYVEQLALNTKVAKYWEDSTNAIRDLLTALTKHFPPEASATSAPAEEWQYLDHAANGAVLDSAAVNGFRGQLREEIGERLPAALTAVEFLDRARLRAEGQLTRTGALLFAEDPTGISPAAMVKCTHYHGSDRAAARESRTFTGTVPEQIREALRFVTERVRMGEAPAAGQAHAADVYWFPMVAVREVIANALVHRDYEVTDRCVHVRLFAERLEVSSPGGWQGARLDDGVEYALGTLEGHSVKRNFRLAHVLSWIRLVEGEGSGIPSALSDCRTARSPEPVVVQDEGFVTITLRRSEPEPGSGEWRALIPVTIPADSGDHVGREEALMMLDSLLRTSAMGEPGGRRIVVISGLAGVGKTALAVHWAHRVRDRFPDGLLYADLHGGTPGRPPTEPAEALRRFLDALGFPTDHTPPDEESMAAVYRSLLHDRKVLVVLDDAGTADQVSPLVPGGPECMVLVTSRRRMPELTASSGAHSLHLDLLSESESAEFLARRLGQARMAAEPEAAAELIDRCGRLPLALAIAAALVADRSTYSLADLVGELRQADERLDALDLGGDTLSVRGVFASSYQALSAAGATMFRLLGFHPGLDIGLGAAVALSGLDRGPAQRSLAELVRQSLLAVPSPGRYRSHDLVHEYAAELAIEESASLRPEAIGRVVDYYLATAIDAARFLNPHRDPITTSPPAAGIVPGRMDDFDQAMSWFGAECSHLPDVVEEAARLELDDRAWPLAWALATYLDLRGYWRTLIDSQTTALTVAERLGDLRYQALSHRFLGRAYGRIDIDDQAISHHQRAITLYKVVGDLSGEANSLYDLAEIRHLRGRYAEALADAQHAARCYERVGNSAGIRDAAQLISAIDARWKALDQPVEPTASYPTIFIVDVVGGHSRIDHQRMSIRAALYEALRTAVQTSEISWDGCHVEDRGDGVLIIVPANVPKSAFLETLLPALARQLRQYNQSHAAAARFRLRVVLHAGEIHQDDHGVAGVAINHAFRLIDAPGFRRRLSGPSESAMGLIVSEWFYDQVVRHVRSIEPGSFENIDVKVKETSTRAWISLTDQ